LTEDDFKAIQLLINEWRVNCLKISIGECPLGIFALNRKGKIVESEPFPRDSGKIAEKLFLIEKGNLSDEHIELVENLINDGYEEFVLESREIASQLRERFNKADFEVVTPDESNKRLRMSIRDIARDFGFENVNEILQNVNVLLTRKKLRKKASERDKIIVQAINSVDEIDETINGLYGRIKEWYGIHFPELERYISEYAEYFRLILKLGRRQNFTLDNLTDLNIEKEKAEKIRSDAEDSIGASFNEEDIETIQANVKEIIGLQKAREKTSEYLEELMKEIAPNIRTLVGSLTGARLIALAGGLDDLAKKPSSTIQVLGAEKALFRSLNKGTKPPKHGVIFQYPEIRKSPESIRGKIARALAGKLAIAARVDAMSGRYIGDRLEEEVEERIEAIKRNK